VSTIGALAVLAVLATTGIAVAVSAWLQPAPSLARTLQHIQRRGAAVSGELAARHSIRRDPADTLVGKLSAALVDSIGRGSNLLPTETQLRVLGRPIERHVVLLAASAIGGLFVPTLLVSGLQRAGIIGLGWYAPLIAGLACAVLGPLLVHTATVERAHSVRADLRYQVSAYLDLVTMLLAGNTGYEGALEQAARAGDGRLFAELRRRMRESSARGVSLTEALERTGAELGLTELEQIAATAALSAAEGAPVARTLAAKCGTLRAALSSEQETEARLRTSRLTTPIVGMALIFMALVIYPALTFQ
jgi:Flp pilus assembly protein TadB